MDRQGIKVREITDGGFGAARAQFRRVNCNLQKIRLFDTWLVLPPWPLRTGAAEPAISRHQMGAWEDDIGYRPAVRKQFYATDFPAATWVQVARLFDPVRPR